MATGYQINNVDTDLLYVRKDVFLEGNLWGWGSNGFGQLGDNTATTKSSPVQTITGGSNWSRVACGMHHTIGIKSDGTLWLSGYNNQGQLGDNTITNRSSPIQTITGGNNWKQADGGTLHTAAIKIDGTLWVCGYNLYGQLGDNTTTPKSSPIQTLAGGSNWKQVACGQFHTVAIKTDGTLWGWGWNGNGGLGDNTTVHKSSPVQTIAGGTNWKQVSGGAYNTAAIKTDGSLWIWGEGSYGNIGDNTTNSPTSPVQTVSGGTNWKQVSCGYHHVTAIKTDGTLWGWGYNGYGGLGDGTISWRSSPVQTLAGGTNWKQVDSGRYQTVAIKTNGTIWSWGKNGSGELGDNTQVDKSVPVQTLAAGINWKQIACGYHAMALNDPADYLTLPTTTQIASIVITVSAYTLIPGNTITCTVLITYNDGTTSTDCTRLNWVFTPSSYVSISTTAASSVITALQTGAGTLRAIDGTTGVTSQVYNITITGSKLYGWGDNIYGQLGDNTAIQKTSPVQTISSGTNWKQMSSSSQFTIAVKFDGTLWTWGYNGYGQLGDNTSTGKSSPVQTITGGSNWKQAANGYRHVAAIKTDGTLWAWGSNTFGQLGDASVTDKSSPVQTIAGGSNWKQAACGSWYTCAIKTDGTLWAWGSNTYGELGDNTTIKKSSPIQTIAGGTNWNTISCGDYHTVSIKTDNSLWVCGYNAAGQLGDNTLTSRSSPIQVVTGGAWATASCGTKHVAAIKTNGTLWLWGSNDYGQLGDNTIINKSSPIQAISGGSSWVNTACGYGHTIAVNIDGAMWTWGRNNNGQLNTFKVESPIISPVQVISGTTWSSLANGWSAGHNLGIKLDGTLWGWGSNSYGNLGDGSTLTRLTPIQIPSAISWSVASRGTYHSAAIKTDGTLWMWGRCNYGQLGDGTVVSKSSPIQTIAGGSNWSSVKCGGGQTAAIKTDGTLWCWGYNGFGQLGDGTRVQKSSPVQTIAGGTNWKQVACSQYSIVAIKTDGTLWGWGYNLVGTIGDNTSTNTSSPVQVYGGGTNWSMVDSGQDTTAALKTDGTLWVWGSGADGQLGDASVTDKSSPVQTIAGGSNWSSVACGYRGVAAIKTDGTLWLWGYNQYGQLGDGTVIKKSSPVQTTAGGTNWRSIIPGSNYTNAITTSNSIWGWGWNSAFSVGNIVVQNLSSPIQIAASGTAWTIPSSCRFSNQTFAINNSYINTITLTGSTTGIVNSTSYTYTLRIVNSDNSISYDCNQVLWSTNPSSLSTVISQDPSSIVLQFSGAQSSWQLIATDNNNNTVTGILTLSR